MPRFRAILDTMPPYKAGKAVMSADGRSYKLSSNESPYGPLPSVVDAIVERPASIHRYPGPGCTALTRPSPGSTACRPSTSRSARLGRRVAQQLLETIGEPGAEVVYAWRSFEAYPLLADLSGVTSVRVPLTDETHDLEAMADAITPRTRLVFVCNPNNPTGTVVRRRRAGGLPRPGARGRAWSCWTRPTASTSGTRTSPTGSTSTATGPTWRCCGRSPRRTAWPGCAWAT